MYNINITIIITNTSIIQYNIYIYIYIEREREMYAYISRARIQSTGNSPGRSTRRMLVCTANLPTNIVDFTGFDSSII